VKHYTGIALCPTAQVEDRTTSQESNTVPGFSYHVTLTLDPHCVDDFKRQLSAISPPDCSREFLQLHHECYVQDASAASGIHTSIMASMIAPGRYDVRFYE